MQKQKLLAAIDFAGAKITRVKHFKGLPGDDRDLLPAADFLVIEDKEDGIFLVRYTGGGRYVGDTWHQSIGEAKEQAAFEFGDLLGEWKSIPAEISDPEELAEFSGVTKSP